MRASRTTDDMVAIPGGEFLMGSQDFYPEEGPVRPVSVEPFWIDPAPVTVDEFARFVDETSYLTFAERPIVAEDYPGADPDLLKPGSAVFRATRRPVDLTSLVWWRYVPGASWRHPEGPGTDVRQRGSHPVTHVAYEDAAAYAAWAGKTLPTEPEWERAARGGLEGKAYAWGDEETPGGRWLANTWQGEFPWQNHTFDGYRRTSPVRSFPANGFGLYDMIGNVWEWTCDEVAPQTQPISSSPCCPPAETPKPRFPSHVVKGGSFLCAPNYCLRYRPAARQFQTIDTSTSHVGFRCVVRA